VGQVDPSGNWRTWHTEHFRIHAKADHASHALSAAREAERAYRALSTELKPPRGRIDLVLNDAVDFSNGLATVFPSNRLTINLAPPATSGPLGVYDDWLRLVITHELTHIFHLDRSDGIWRILQKLFGRAPGLFPNTYQPGWVSEGVATYYESRFTEAGRVRGAYHTQLLGATARDGTWPTSGDAVRVNRVWPAGTRPYAWGGRFFDRQRTVFGDSVVPRFIERTSRQLIAFNVSRPLKGAGGESVGDGWRRLEQPLAPSVGERRVLERGLRVGPDARVSPDGTRICFRYFDGKSTPRIVIRDLRTGEDVASHRVTSSKGMAWVGDTLFVAQLEYSSPVTIRSDIYRWNPGQEWERVSTGARHTDVFSTGDGRVGLVSLEPRGRTVGAIRYPDQTITPFPTPGPSSDWGRLAVSPDAAWVAAARHSNQRWDIVLWPSGRPGEATMVTSDASLDADPVWSSDGQSLLFSSERSGLPQIYSYDLLTGRTYQLTNEPTGARQPAVVGDGTILFSTVLGDGHALLQQELDVLGPAEPSVRVDTVSSFIPSDVSVRESSYSPWPALRPHFWIPIAHDEGPTGAYIGALTVGVDPIGRNSYSAIVAASPETGRMEGVLYYSHRRWQSWTIDAAVGQTWDYDPFLYQGSVVPASFRERAAELGVRRKWRRWRTGAELRFRGFVERDVIVNEGSEPLPFTPRNPTFAGGAISAGLSHLSRPSLSISPEDGVSLETMLLRRWHTGDTDLWSYEARGKVAGYLALPLPGFSRWVLAANVAAGITGGTAPTSFSVGGESGDIVELIPGTALGSGRRRFQMRGYSSRGGFTRAVVGVAELRMPLVLVARGVPKLPVFLDRLSLNLFGEAGSGWNDGDAIDVTSMRDVGGEVAVDLGLGAGFAMKTRLGAAVALTDWLDTSRGSVRYYVAFGRAF